MFLKSNTYIFSEEPFWFAIRFRKVRFEDDLLIFAFLGILIHQWFQETFGFLRKRDHRSTVDHIREVSPEVRSIVQHRQRLLCQGDATEVVGTTGGKIEKRRHVASLCEQQNEGQEWQKKRTKMKSPP